MGIFQSIKSEWNSRDTAGKIDMILDVICGFGTAAVGGVLYKHAAPNLNRVERVCAKIAICGVSMAASEVAANAFHPYTKATGLIIDTVKAKSASKKEDVTNGK